MSVQLYGYDFGGTCVFFSLFYAFFSKIRFRFWWFSNPTWWKKIHRESTTCKWVCEMNRGIHCKSGTSFMVLAVNAGISIWNEECSVFPHFRLPVDHRECALPLSKCHVFPPLFSLQVITYTRKPVDPPAVSEIELDWPAFPLSLPRLVNAWWGLPDS